MLMKIQRKLMSSSKGSRKENEDAIMIIRSSNISKRQTSLISTMVLNETQRGLSRCWVFGSGMSTYR
ncbi:Protein of unknown function [Gryllus bimaculatus]|nr:Protein of unknown function [Gryllus bimaculatus]